jgi:glycerate kinase
LILLCCLARSNPQARGKRNIPIVGITRSLAQDIDLLYGNMGVIFGTVRSPGPLAQALEQAEKI